MFLILGFSLSQINAQRAFIWDENPPAMRVEAESYTKNHLSATIEVSKPLLQERKGDLHGEESQWFSTYKMDVQISYRLHTKV